MFGLMRLAFTLLICLLVAGFFLGWFSFSRTPPDPQTNRENINVSVDRRKMGTDLQHLEQKVNQGIQGLQNPPPNNQPPGAQANARPGLSLGPITIQPGGQSQVPGGQSGIPGLSFGPITVQPSGQATIAPNSQYGAPQNGAQTPGYQFAPLNLPPPGER